MAIIENTMRKTFFQSLHLNFPKPSYDERKTISTTAGTKSPSEEKKIAPTRLREKKNKIVIMTPHFIFSASVNAHLITGSRSGTAIPTAAMSKMMTVRSTISETFLVFAILFSIFFNRISMGM